MIKAIIIDDDKIAIEIIDKLSQKIQGLEVVSRFDNAINAISYLNQNSVDLIFLDIHMPDLTGFDFIDALSKPPKVILTTSDTELALDAFEYSCIIDYLVKPISLPRFIKSINKLQSQIPSKTTSDDSEKEEQTDELYINIDRRLVKLKFDEINIIEAKGDYILIKTNDKNYIVHSSMKKIQSRLPEKKFMKVHRSYIVNISKIIDIEDNSILIKEDVIPVSRSNRQLLMDSLNLL